VHHSRDSYLQRSDTEPRLGLEWQWSPQTLLSAGWGRYNQIPDGPQIAPVIGNPALDHLHATHSVLGLSQAWGERWSTRVELYRKTLSDLVVADAARNYVNGGSGTAHGLELLIKKNAVPGEALSGWLSFSWARSTRHNDLTGEDFRFAYDQPLIVHLVGVWRLPGGWQLSSKWTYHSGLPDTAIVGTTTDGSGRTRPVYGPLNGDRLPAYHRLDLRGERQLSPKLHVYVEVINAYNRRNVSGWSYSEDYQSREAVRSLGLLPSAGLRLQF
jgi:outer membrane receptor protein involved in Fe transport